MPTRSEESAALINSLEIKEPDKNCNARTPTGYCKNISGFKTAHPHSGRCYLHGGNAGAPIISGKYSKKLKTTLQEEYEALNNDPKVIELRSELVLVKTLVSKYVDNISTQLDDPTNSFWTQRDNNGIPQMSSGGKTLLTLLDTLTKLFDKISNAEKKAQEHLDLHDIHKIINQIRNIMDDTCSDCPVRSGVGERLSNVKIPHKN